MANADTPSRGPATPQPGPRTLVIGCGFIGSNVVEELATAGRPPAVLTRSAPSPAVAALVPEGHLHLGDAGDREAVEAALDGIEHVVFSSGGLLPAASEEDPEEDERLTLRPLRTVLEALRSRPDVAFTYLSSGGTVYGEPERVPVSEDAPTAPIGSYARLHLACEADVLRARDEFGLPARILRCATVYGPHQNPNRGQGVVVTFLDRIESGEQVTIFGGGTTERDYVYSRDVARAVALLLEHRGGPSILNLGSGRGTRLIDVLRLTERQVGGEAERVELPPRDFEVQRVVLDISRLRELVGFEPTPLDQGIAHTHAWLKTSAPEQV